MEYKRKVKISNKVGFHVRAVSMFVIEAEKFTSDVKVKCNDVEVDGKSIMSVLGLGAEAGKEIEITTTGPDSKEAMAKLVKLVENKFGED